MGSSEYGARDGGRSIGSLVGVVAAKQTYKNLAYLLLAIPLGFAYVTILFFGLTFGTFFSVVLVGIPIVIVTILGARLLAAFERVLANALLPVDLEAPDDVRAGDGDGLVSSLGRYLEAPSTWRSLGFLPLKAWMGFVAFILLFVLATIVSLLTAPFSYPTETEFVTVDDQPITWTIDTLPELGLAVVLGLVLAVVFLHVTNAVAYLAERMAVAMLDDPISRGGSSVSSDSAVNAVENGTPAEGAVGTDSAAADTEASESPAGETAGSKSSTDDIAERGVSDDTSDE